MIHPDHPELIGSYRLTWELGRARTGERWVAVDERTGESKAIYRLEVPADSGERRRLLDAIERNGKLNHPHLLTVERFSLDRRGHAWLVTPYRGHNEGLMTIDGLADAQNGRLEAIETDRTMEQILDGVRTAHELGIHHGTIDPGDLLVDRHGSVWIELYGLVTPATEREADTAMLVRDEIRSVVQLGYRLLTGLPAEEPRLPAARIVKKLDKAWDRWFDRGLDPTDGFASAAEALGAMPGRSGAGAESPQVSTRPVRRVLARFQRAGGPTAKPSE